ncbi:ankyrin repeat domain-containing protein [Paenibacillus koleovorans]|nr:ankyrin repeat domain-containing protein [Paenibacillus koleovorans]
MQTLLDAKADPNARNKKGTTALGHAQNFGFRDVAEPLRQYGAVI